MKKTILVIFVLIIKYSSAQYFGHGYTRGPGGIPTANAVISRAADGTIFGSTGSGGTYFSVYRLNAGGDMLWNRRVSLPSGQQIAVPYSICVLNDSTVVASIGFFGTNGFYLVKMDFNGNIVWSRQFNFPIYETPFDIVPASNGGMIVNSHKDLMFINAQGDVIKNLRFTDMFIYNILPKNTDEVTVLASSNLTNSPVIFDCDSLGNLNNSMSYSFSNDSIQTALLVPSRLISRSTSGGIFCTMSLKNNPSQSILLMYVNSSHQAVWSKKINQLFNTRNVQATDNGCILTAQRNTGSNNVPVVSGFDSLGALLWSKTAGDPTATLTDYKEVLSIISDGASGIYYTMNVNYETMFHSDYTMSNLCTSQTYSLSSTAITATLSTITPTSTNNTTTSSAITATAVNESLYRYDACTAALINVWNDTPELINEDLVSVYPNPASDFLHLSIPVDFRFNKIRIIDMLGNIRSELNSDINDINIPVADLAAGTYAIQIISDNVILKKLFVRE